MLNIPDLMGNAKCFAVIRGLRWADGCNAQRVRLVQSRNLVFIFNKLIVNSAKGKAANNNPITILVSTHDMKLVEELCPRTLVIDEGVIVADGKTKEILADAKLLEAHGLEKP